MSYSHRIEFLGYDSEIYNPDTGMYEGGGNVTDVLPCSVSDLGIHQSMQLFGDFQLNRKVVRLQQPYTKPFNRVRLDGFVYVVKTQKLDKTVFYLEMANHG